ncbi:MAG TPA: LuxR C-terminal-related transcriptional regulator [Dehalococcoidia bacterium]|nr:LuxR C-terminal-related transcriptional regulator [Dehalococcoidia bacterium]
MRELLAEARSGAAVRSTPPSVVLLPARPTAARGALPSPLTPLVGRHDERAVIIRLLSSGRLVTLTGAGGAGKTRLALEVAAELAETFADGVVFVNLAPLRDPELVPAAIAQALGVQGLTGLPVRDSVIRYVREKRLLLLLDNYEHLLAAAEFAGALLQAGLAVTLLVTSRAPLRVNGEQEYPVSPLLVPEAESRPAAVLAQNPAVQLFVLRAQAVRPDFALSEENAAAVAAICIRLDGLPLAIELAAARVRVLPPAALLARLAQRLPLLTGGRRDLPARQQTLRNAIAWSYDVLEPAEQRLFRRLGVFAGGCTLELAGAVCNAAGDLGLDVLDGLSSLVEKSLLREGDGEAGEPRYRMLETICEFALDALGASGEAEAVRRQLATQMLQLAQQCAATGNWPRLDAELDNARAVLGWCIERAELDAGVRLFWALRGYLYIRGRGNEQQLWRRRLLALPEAAPPSVSRARLLALSPADLLSTADQDRAVAELEEAIGLSRQLGDTRCLAQALERLALLRLNQNNPGAAVPLAEEAVALRLQAGAIEAAVNARSYLTTVAVTRGDVATAERLVAANRAFPGTAGTAVALFSEALLAMARGDDAQVRVLLEDYVQRVGVEQGGKGPDRLVGLTYLAWVAFQQGDTGAAVATCGEMLAVQRELGPTRFLPAALSVLAQAAERCGLFAASARLLAATDVARREFAAEVFGLHAGQQAAVERVRAALDEATFAEAWAAGAALSADAAIELGFAVVAQLQRLLATDTVAAEPHQTAFQHHLTAREVEVLRLIAAGKSTREIARTLVISDGTVERHVTNLYTKIGAHSRAEAAAYAFRHGLVSSADV